MFQIFDKDKVTLKIWTENGVTLTTRSECDFKSSQITKKLENKCLKTKPCLFNLYHPNGCLLNDLNCDYIHNK